MGVIDSGIDGGLHVAESIDKDGIGVFNGLGNDVLGLAGERFADVRMQALSGRA
jgi:hypothetical protein